MPIIGHTLAGIVIAQQAGRGGRRHPPGFAARALWTPLIVLFSYLPDIATQAGQWMGFESAQAAGHSIPFGLIAGALAGMVWARLTGAPVRLLVMVAAGAIVLHDMLDLLQDAERMPLWPLSARMFGVDWLTRPDRLWGEAVYLGVPFLIYEGWRVARGAGRLDVGVTPPARSQVWVSRGLVVTVLLAALTVLQLRQIREREMDEAITLRRAGRYTEALVAIDRAERWPSSAGAGDIVRGEAYSGLGDWTSAEAAFLRAYQKDPDEFWPVASLAQHYASRGTRAERRQRSAPLVETLQRDYSGHEALAGVLDRIERSVMKAPD